MPREIINQGEEAERERESEWAWKTLRNHNHCGTHANVSANALQCQIVRSKKESIYNTHTYKYTLYICVDGFEQKKCSTWLGLKKQTKAKAKKAKQTQKQQADILWLSLSEIGIGIEFEKGRRGEGNQVQEFSFRGICLCVFMSSG